MLDECLLQLGMLAGVEGKGTFVLHQADQSVHRFRIVQIDEDATVDGQKTTVFFKKLFKLQW